MYLCVSTCMEWWVPMEVRTGHHIPPYLIWVLGLKFSPLLECQVLLTTERTLCHVLKLLNALSLHLGRGRGVEQKQLTLPGISS